MSFQQAYNSIFARIPEMAFSEQLIVLTVLRQTLGWHKETDIISYSQFEKFTGLCRESVARGIEAALARGIIGRREAGSSFEYWLVCSVDSAVDNPQDDITEVAPFVDNSDGGEGDYPQSVDSSQGENRVDAAEVVYPVDIHKERDIYAPPDKQETLLRTLEGINLEIRELGGKPFYDVPRLAVRALASGVDAGLALTLWNQHRVRESAGPGLFVWALCNGVTELQGKPQKRRDRRVVEEFRRELASVAPARYNTDTLR